MGLQAPTRTKTRNWTRKWKFSALLSCALLAIATEAAAQQNAGYVEQRTAKGQDVRFEDDPLDAVARDPIGAQITAWITARRFQLMRPRQSFVTEMVRGVEAL
jgi:hypothetical protein